MIEMEIRKISEDGKNIEIEIDVDLTILNSLIDELLKSENVEIAIIKSGHPLVDKKKNFCENKKNQTNIRNKKCYKKYNFKNR